MKVTGRAARMQRHYARKKGARGLNLVSLMDIFTILVFFLLVNSSDVQVLPNTKEIQLPESVAETKARETVVVMITEKEILVNGRSIANIEQVLRNKGNIIRPLEAALRQQHDKILRKDEQEEIAGREITIMGDREIPYRLLKKVMATCTEADYGQLSLAVLQKSGELVAAVKGES